MSNIYIQEPPTSGKVLLRTSIGDIDIELWSKECPLACRNFIQLCLEGYYNGTIFHRVVKGFIVQGGDVNGDGTGGESSYGHPFKDEFHSRLRFVRRGLVGMANCGKNDNGSQFFFTLGATPELQNQNTLFGKVTGDTIYNMLKLEEGEVYENERPHFTHRIVKAEVLNNPFEDIVPRRLTGLSKSKKAGEDARKTKKEQGVKNFGLLSFGDEAEVEELEANVFAQKSSATGRGKSSHDVLDDSKLSKQTVDLSKPGALDQRRSLSDEEEISSNKSDEQASLRQQTETRKLQGSDIRNKLKRRTNEKPEKEKETIVSESNSDSDYGIDSEKKKAKKTEAEKIRKEISQLKRDYHTDRRSKQATKDNELQQTLHTSTRKECMNEVFQVQQEYLQKTKQVPKKGASRENFTMELLNKFKTKLQSAHERGTETTQEESTAAGTEEKDIHGNGWLSHKLEFDKKDPILAKDAATKDDDWYDVYDPRNPLNKRKRGEKLGDRSRDPKNKK